MLAGSVPKGGRSKAKVSSEKVGVLLPAGLHAEMLGIMAAEQRWFDRQDFIKEAVREKIERHRAKPAPHPAASQVIERTRST